MASRFMDNKKDDKYYLKKMLDDVDFVIAHTKGMNSNDIELDDLLVDSIMFRLVQIAESSDKVTAEFKATHKELPWKEIKGMRNRIVHDYGIVDLSIICDTVLNGFQSSIFSQTKNIQGMRYSERLSNPMCCPSIE